MQKESKALVRIVGQVPLAATIYEIENLRCSAWGQMFTAEETEGAGRRNTMSRDDRAAQVWQWHPILPAGAVGNPVGHSDARGHPVEVVEEAADVIKPAHEELIRQVAQGEVLHNDDTTMRDLHLEHKPSDERADRLPLKGQRHLANAHRPGRR